MLYLIDPAAIIVGVESFKNDVPPSSLGHLMCGVCWLCALNLSICSIIGDINYAYSRLVPERL